MVGRRKKGRGGNQPYPYPANLSTVAVQVLHSHTENSSRRGLEIPGRTLLSTIGAENSCIGNSSRRGLEIPGWTLFPTVGLPHWKIQFGRNEFLVK